MVRSNRAVSRAGEVFSEIEIEGGKQFLYHVDRDAWLRLCETWEATAEGLPVPVGRSEGWVLSYGEVEAEAMAVGKQPLRALRAYVHVAKLAAVSLVQARMGRKLEAAARKGKASYRSKHDPYVEEWEVNAAMNPAKLIANAGVTYELRFEGGDYLCFGTGRERYGEYVYIPTRKEIEQWQRS